MKYVGRRSSNSATARTSFVRRVAVLVVVFMGSSGIRRAAPTRELLPGGERGPFLHHTLRAGHGPESTNSPVTTDSAPIGLVAPSVFARGSSFGGQVAAPFPGPRSGSPADEAAGSASVELTVIAIEYGVRPAGWSARTASVQRVVAAPEQRSMRTSARLRCSHLPRPRRTRHARWPSRGGGSAGERIVGGRERAGGCVERGPGAAAAAKRRQRSLQRREQKPGEDPIARLAARSCERSLTQRARLDVPGAPLRRRRGQLRKRWPRASRVASASCRGCRERG